MVVVGLSLSLQLCHLVTYRSDPSSIGENVCCILGNGGINRPLSIIKQDLGDEGERVIDEVNATAVLDMLESVVLDGGTAPKARVPGYRVAGKTGTSRKAVAGGYGTDYVNTFAGVAPVSNPQVAVVVLINEPAGDLYHAGDTAAPLFSSIMAGTLQLLNVAPDDKPVSLLAERRQKLLQKGE